MRCVVILLAGLLAVAASRPINAAAQSPRLSGVVLGVQGGGVAYIEDPQTGRVRAVRVGDSVGDAQVVRIEADRVVLQQGGDTVEIRLSGGPPSSPGLAGSGSPAARPAASPAPEAATAGTAAPLCPPFCPTPAPGATDAAQTPAALPCPPFCPAPEPSSPSTEAPPPPQQPVAPGLPCPPFCPAPGAAPAETPAAPPFQPTPSASPLPCPPFCPTPRP